MSEVYNTIVKDYGNGRKKIAVFDRGIIALNDDEKEYKKLLKDMGCDRFGCIVDDDIQDNDTKSDDSTKALKLIDNNNRAKMKIYDLALSNNWDWFFTFTFSPEKVDRTNYDECIKKLRNWLKKIKESKVNPFVKTLFTKN